MSASENKPRSVGKTKRESQSLAAPVRRELTFALSEARALLDTAHVIESTLGPLVFGATPKQVQSAVALVRKQSPELFERLLNVCVRLERIALLTPTKDE